MPTLEFREAANLTPAQAQQVEAMLKDDDNPFPAGFQTVSLFGYIDQATDAIVAWAWGSDTSTEGELHLIVLDAFQGKKIGPRLAMRYYLWRNSQVTDFVFIVTNPTVGPALLADGFTPHPVEPDAYVRMPYAGQDLVKLQNNAAALNALDPVITV